MEKKKKTLIIIALAVIVFVLLSLGGYTVFKFFSDPVYDVSSGFYYSSDKGHSYGDGTKEFEVGKTVYMKVKFKVTSDKKSVSQVKVILSIPNVQNVDAKYMDGQVITPNYDAINNVTTYEFTANASRDAKESECVIQFIPNAIGSVSMTLIYDDCIDSSYDVQSTLVFVEPEANVSEG